MSERDTASSEPLPIREKKSHIVRQKRIEVYGDDGYLKIGDEKYEIFDCTPFGLAIIADPNFSFTEISDGEIIYREKFIGKVHLKKIRKEIFNSEFKKIAFEVIGEPIEIDRIKAIKAGQAVLKEHSEAYSKYLAVPQAFRRGVYEMKDWLETLRTRVNQLSETFDLNSVSEITIYEEAAAELVGEFIVKAVEPQYAALEESLKGLSPEARASAFEFFRQKLREVLMEGPFPNRSFTKPLGYAGDYQMMNQIYSREAIGNSIFAKSVHLYFVLTPESKAVRNRAKYLKGQIKSLLIDRKSIKPLNILSVASGPAMEVQLLIKEDADLIKNVNFHFLDQEIESLEFAQRQIRNLAREYNVPVSCNFMKKGIKHVIAGGLRNQEFDLIYSAGLFDYFSDPVAQVTAQRLLESLSTPGRLIVGNFNVNSPNKFGMSIALDWQLIYRSKEDLERLFNHLDGEISIEQEPEGVNLFCNITKD